MGFLSPLSLLYALSIAILVAIYLQSRTRPTLEVPSLSLFEDLEEPVRHGRVIQLDLIFWLETAALATLTLAIAGTYLRLPAGRTAARRRALVFDVAAGMDARDGKQSRLERARAEALRILSNAGSSEQFSIIDYATDSATILPASSDHAELQKGVEGLRHLDVPARASAFEAAMMRARDAEQVELFADRIPPGASLSAFGDPGRVHFHRLGSSDTNCAIVSLDPGIVGATQGHCVVRNLSSRAAIIELVIERGGQNVLHIALPLPPNGQSVVPFGPLTAGGLLHAHLATPDALVADNDRYVFAPGGRDLNALIVSPDPAVRDDLARIIRAVDPEITIVAIDPPRLDSVLHAATRPPRIDIALMHDSVTGDLPAAARLLIFPPAAALSGIVGASLLSFSELQTGGDGRPLPRPLLLGAARDLKLPNTLRPVLMGAGPAGQAVALAAMGFDRRGRLGILAFDIRGHRLLDPDSMEALIPSISMVRELLAPEQLQIVSSGDFVAVRSATPVKIAWPDGSQSTVAPDESGLVHFRPFTAGHYVLQGESRHDLFANYFDAAESDIGQARSGPATVLAAQTANGAQAPSRPVPRPQETMLLGLALAALLMEAALLSLGYPRWRERHV